MTAIWQRWARVNLVHATTLSGPDADLLAGLGDLLVLPGGAGVYSVTGQGGGIQQWDAATLDLQGSVAFGAATGLDAPRSLVAVSFEGGMALLAAGAADGRLDGVRLDPDGGLAGVLDLPLPGAGAAQAVSALITQTSGNATTTTQQR